MYSIFRLVCFLFFWSCTSITLVRSATESPLKESISDVQGNFLNAQGQIIRFHAGEVITGGLDELKSRLVILQDEVEKLILASNTRSADTESCISAMNNLTISYSAIESDLRGLQQAFEKHNIFESRTILFRDIIADIRSHRFLLADEKFEKLGDPAAVRKIIHEVYAHSEENFKMVLNFSAAVSNSSRCFSVLRSLYEEISESRRYKVLNLIRLVKYLEREDFNCDSNDTAFSVELTNEIIEAAVHELLRSMKAGHFGTSERVRVVLDAIYGFSPKVFDIVMQRLIDGTSGILDPREVLANIYLRCNSPQVISGISYMYSKINDVFNASDIILDMASVLSELRNRNDFAGLNLDVRSSFDRLVESVPRCARNLFFEDSICFLNQQRNMYLQAVDDKFNYDVERRRVLAVPQSSEGIPQGAAWFPSRQVDDMLFRNRYYSREFLYYANFQYNDEYRYVFSWIEGENRDNQSAFKVQLLDEESCYLKSTRYDEYMFVSDVKYDPSFDYTLVFSRRGGIADRRPESGFVWQIQAC